MKTRSYKDCPFLENLKKSPTFFGDILYTNGLLGIIFCVGIGILKFLHSRVDRAFGRWLARFKPTVMGKNGI
jgi:hypothetical protein